MSFTVWGLGVVLVAIGILLLKGLRGIFSAFIFTAPLFITVVSTIPLGNTVLRTSYFFAIIFLAGYAMLKIPQGRKSIRVHKDLFPVFIYLFVITCSLIMPFFLKGDLQVISFDSSIGTLQSIEYDKLRFRLSNLTQLIYPYFQFILYAVLATYLHKVANVKKVFKILMFSSYLVLATGVIHLILVQVGDISLLKWVNVIVTGPDNFKSAPTGGILGLPRMYSWASEPGYTSFFFLMILSLLSGMLLTDNNFLGRRRKGIDFIFFLGGVILTAGTTGYAGLVILFALILLVKISGADVLNLKRYLRPSIIVVLVVLILVMVNFSSVSIFGNYIGNEHLSKITELTGSGLTRFTIVENNINNFLKSPILGIGYGSERSVAFSTFLLANTGLLGFLSYNFWGLNLMKKMWNILQSKFASKNQKTFALGLFLSFGTMFLLMQFAKSESLFLAHYFWIVAASMLALHRGFKERKKKLT